MTEELSADVPELLRSVVSFGHDASIGLAVSSRAALLRGDFDAAAKDLDQAVKTRGPMFGSVRRDGLLLMAEAATAVERARRAAPVGGAKPEGHRRAISQLRAYLRNSRRYAPDLPESLKLLGSYWWYAGSRRRAVGYWMQSVREAERLGAKVELAHAFADAGRLLGEAVPGPEWRQRGVELYRQLGIGTRGA